MNRNMQSYYRMQKERDLRILMSKKKGELARLGNPNSYWTKIDRVRLEQQIKWIETELISRQQQLSMFD